jgi:hypothetical protein
MEKRATFLVLPIFFISALAFQSFTRGEPGPPLEELLRDSDDFSSPGWFAKDAISDHCAPEVRWKTKTGDGPWEEFVAHHVLAISWFLDHFVLQYRVTEEGVASDVRETRLGWQAGNRKQLSKDEFASLLKILPTLPKSETKPPIERTVYVSFLHDGTWRRETYDSSSLPAALEAALNIIGERFETKDRKGNRQNRGGKGDAARM